MFTRNRFRSSLVGLVALVTLAACSSSNSGNSNGSGSSTKPFVVGAVLPMSGPYAGVGTVASAAFKVAIDKLNTSGGIKGRQIQLVVKDSGGVDVSQAVSAARDLIDNQHVDAMWADDLAAMTLGILPITTQAKIISFTGGSSSTVVGASKFPYQFAFAPVNSVRLPATICGALAQAPGSTKAAVVVTSDATGQATGDGLKAALQAKGVEVVSTVEFDPTATDITAQLTKAKSAGAQFVVMQAAGTPTGTVMRAVQALGWKVPIIGTNGSTTIDPNTTVPAGVQSQFSSVVSGYAARSNADALDANVQPIAAGFQKLGEKITSMEVAVLHYDGMLALAWGFNHAASTKSDDVKTTFESLGANPAQMQSGYLAGSPVPAYSSTLHDPSKSNYGGFFRVVHVSPPLSGTYVGTPVPSC